MGSRYPHKRTYSELGLLPLPADLQRVSDCGNELDLIANRYGHKVVASADSGYFLDARSSLCNGLIGLVDLCARTQGTFCRDEVF